MKNRPCLSTTSQKGSIAILVAAIILPTLFFIYTFSVDLGLYFAETRHLQDTIDAAALTAYRHLPNQGGAENAANSYITARLGEGYSVETSAQDDQIRIGITKLMPLTFARYFGSDLALPVNAFAVAHGTPFEAFIAVDLSSYLSPDVLTGPAWGTDWPSAHFFRNIRPLSDGTTLIDPVLATQQCFNHTLSNVKSAALLIYEYLAAFQNNAIGLGFYPGTLGYIDVARGVQSRSQRSAGGPEGEASWLPYNGVFALSDYCAAAAQEEPYEARFQFPAPAGPLAESPISGTPAHLINPGTWRYNIDYTPYLRTRQVVWSQPARESQIGDTLQTIGELTSNLIGSTSRDLGGISNSLNKTGIIITASLPTSGGQTFPNASITSQLSTQLSETRAVAESNNQRLTLYYLVVPTPGTDLGALSQDIAALQETFNEAQSSEEHLAQNHNGFQALALFANNADELVHSVVNHIVLRRRTAVIAS